MEENLETLVASYVAWQQRVEALEAERPGAHGLTMQLQQNLMETGDSDPQALQTAKTDLMDLDQRLEAATAKLKLLWGQMEEAVIVDIEAKRAAASQTEAALERDFQEQSHQAGVLLAQAINLCNELGFNTEYLSYVMRFRDTGFKNMGKYITEHPITVAFNQTRRKPMNPGAPENADVWTFRLNRWRHFLQMTGSPGSRQTYIRHQINGAIQAAGGSPRPVPSPYFGKREAHYVGKNL